MYNLKNNTQPAQSAQSARSARSAVCSLHGLRFNMTVIRCKIRSDVMLTKRISGSLNDIVLIGHFRIRKALTLVLFALE